MHNTKSGNKNNVTRHLRLVDGNSTLIIPTESAPCVDAQPQPSQINYLTHAMMNRLWIPQTTTIIGLLNVGSSKDNFQELHKWITKQLSSRTSDSTYEDLPHLEQLFRRAVNHYPSF